MQFSTLADSGIGITRDEFADLFEPFVARQFSGDDPVWVADISRRKRKILKKYIRSLLLGWLPAYQRNQVAVIKEYSRAWHINGYSQYNLEQPLRRLGPWVNNGEHMFASDLGATRVRQLLLIRIIEMLKPRNVLEVGCGNGINLLLLAGRFPEIRFSGLELTREGNQAALEFQKLRHLPRSLQEYAPLAIHDTTAFRGIRFRQGNAADMQFRSGEFDLVYTVLALEQMERIRDQALAEISRVTRRYTLMMEPFRDVNDHGWQRLNTIQRDYFRGFIDDLEKFGLDPILALHDFPQELFLKAVIVLSERQGLSSTDH